MVAAAETEAIPEGETATLLVLVRRKQGRLAEAVTIAGRLLARSSYYGRVLPIRELVNDIMAQHDEPMSTAGSVRGLIGVAIVLDVYSRQISSEKDAERSDSYQDVLQRHNVRRASELPALTGAYTLSDMVYFLRFVCVPDVLDQSLFLKSTKAVEDERIAILVAVGSILTANGKSVPAAQGSGKPRPYALTIKSVCDHADREKNDEFQEFASSVSAQFVLEAIKKLPIGR